MYIVATICTLISNEFTLILMPMIEKKKNDYKQDEKFFSQTCHIIKSL